MVIAGAQGLNAFLREQVDLLVNLLHSVEELVPLGLNPDAAVVSHPKPATIRENVSSCYRRVTAIGRGFLILGRLLLAVVHGVVPQFIEVY